MSQIKNLTGQRFGILTALRIDEASRGKGRLKWIVKCDCGSPEKSVYAINLSRTNKYAATKSCGCKTNSTWKLHNRNNRLYCIWNAMIQRCDNPKCKAYPNYGGRGIKVCDRWYDYRKFHEDVIEGYADHLTIDRIENDGHYQPGNIQWSTRTVQNRHNRHTVLTQDDVDFIRQSILPTAQIARMLKVAYGTVASARNYKSWK
jgi:hypothetical protein